MLSPGKKIETFREWHKNESKAHKINFNLYHRYSQYNCLLPWKADLVAGKCKKVLS